MKKSLLYGIFLSIIGISFMISRLNFTDVSYAYQNKANYQVTFNYLLKDDSNIFEEVNSQFQILTEDYKIVDAFNIDLMNSYTVKHLNKQRYILRQLKAPNDYDALEDFYFTITKEDETVNIYTRKSTSPKIALLLMDINTNKILVGGEFHLIDDDNLISSCTTHTGYCYMNNLAEGIYTLENVIVAPGYQIINNQKIEITDIDKTKHINLYARPTKITLNSYYNSKNYRLTDGIYGLYDQKGNYLYQIKDDYIITNLEAGSYYLREEKAPNGFLNLKKDIKFEITENTDNEQINIYYQKMTKNIILAESLYLFGCFSFIIGIISLTYYYRKNSIITSK